MGGFDRAVTRNFLGASVMEGEDIILLAGAAGLAILILSRQQQDLSFTSFMDSSGASEADIAASIVPVNDQTPQQTGTMPSIKDFANAIFNFEGGKPGNLNVRNNNPGNLKAAPDEFTGTTTVRDANGFVIFPSFDAGFAALQNQLNKTVNDQPSLTLTQFFARYLGQSDFLNPKVTSQGDPFSYANTVAGKLGVSPETPIGQIFGG